MVGRVSRSISFQVEVAAEAGVWGRVYWIQRKPGDCPGGSFFGRTSEDVPSNVVCGIEADCRLGLLLYPVTELHLLPVVFGEESKPARIESDGQVRLESREKGGMQRGRSTVSLRPKSDLYRSRVAEKGYS